jgi:mRNA interferase YafQ
MYEIRFTTRFKKDYKTAVRRGYDIGLLRQVIELLAAGKKLPEKYRDHSLSGNWQGHRECHIMADWLLIYRIDNDVLVLTLTRTGTHADLLQK